MSYYTAPCNRGFFPLVSHLSLFCLAVFAVSTFVPPQAIAAENGPPRNTILISGVGWQFAGGSNSDVLPSEGTESFRRLHWKDVTVPHIFQTRIDMSISQGWYRRQITVPATDSGKRLYFVFEGVAAIADVYVNGKFLGEHRGAYTRFVQDGTNALHVGSDNEVDVYVDNRSNGTGDCLPSVSGLYTVWGGMYRNIWLMTASQLLIDPTYYGSPGVFVTPGNISSASASVQVKTILLNNSAVPINAIVVADVIAPNGSICSSLSSTVKVGSGARSFVLESGTVAAPMLWSPEMPNLYHVKVDVYDGATLMDSVTQPLGFRSVVWDFKHGQIALDGKKFVLYGCDLHQEIETKQSAVDESDLLANLDSLQDLGANFVRFSHYPRAQIEYDECDRRGIFCWAENGHSHNDQAGWTADIITTEMVLQNYNHPSIIVWSVGNEGSAPPADREVPVVKSLDLSRPVVVANMKSNLADYHTTNTYPGWYGSDRWSFKPTGFISEIGAGGVVTTHTDYAKAARRVDSFEPEEWQQLVAESSFELAFRHNNGKLGMYTWWILRDFNDVKYKHTLAPFGHGLNTKGLETYSGFKKDVYYLYRCFLRPDEPTVHITSKFYFLRRGASDNGIKVYSNAAALTLTLNGTVVSTQQNGSYVQNDLSAPKGANQEVDNVFFWHVPLKEGKNSIMATDDSGHSDSCVVYYVGEDSAWNGDEDSAYLSDLTSSNPYNPVFVMDTPLAAQQPIYDDFDSTADNSLDSVPAEVKTADWLALRRVTKVGQATDVTFTAKKQETVYCVVTKSSGTPIFLRLSHFNLVNAAPLQWRGNDMILVDAQLYDRQVQAGEKVSLHLAERDTLIAIGK